MLLQRHVYERPLELKSDPRYQAAFGPQPIPEPATLTLIGLGLSGIGLARRKTR
jgi:hypothetical protein